MREYRFERFFVGNSKFELRNSNKYNDNLVTITGTRSQYLAIYLIQSEPFYRQVMLRFAVTVPMDDFNKLSEMYSLNMVLTQIGIVVRPCLSFFEFFTTDDIRHCITFQALIEELLQPKI